MPHSLLTGIFFYQIQEPDILHRKVRTVYLSNISFSIYTYGKLNGYTSYVNNIKIYATSIFKSLAEPSISAREAPETLSLSNLETAKSKSALLAPLSSKYETHSLTYSHIKYESKSTNFEHNVGATTKKRYYFLILEQKLFYMNS